MPEEHPEDRLLEVNEAVKYLAQRWGMESYSLQAFRALRHRWHITPALGSKTATFWRKSDLDKIPKPDRSRPRGKRVKKNGADAAHHEHHRYRAGAQLIA